MEESGHYKTLKDNQVILVNYYTLVITLQVVTIHPRSSVEFRAEWLVYEEFICTRRNYIRQYHIIDIVAC